MSRPGLAGRLTHGKFLPLQGQDGRTLVVGTKDLPAKIIPRPDGGAWILEGGIFLEARPGPNRWRHVSADGRVTEPRPFPWPELNFDYRTPRLDHAGNLWLYVSGLGLAKLSPDGQRYEVYGRTEGLNENEVCTVFEDRQQNLWVWDRRGTVRRLRQPLFATLDSRWGLRTDNVYSLSPAREGGVWIGTHNSGAYLWREDRLFAFWKAKPHSWSILEDREGGLWNGTYGWELRRFRAGHEEVIRSPEAGDHGHAHALFEDRSGRVWIGGRHGLSRYDLTSGAVKTFVPPRFDRASPDWVTSLAEDREGAIWLGTRGGFLHRFQNGEFQTLLAPKGDPIHAVCSLRFLLPDELWFARFGDGISRLKDGQLSHYASADGLPAATINGLLDDGRGRVWMTSKQGVFRILNQEFEAFAQRKPGAFHWQRFTRWDGLPSEECHGEQNQPTLCQTADGRIWIPTVGGIGVIDPATLGDTDIPAPAIIQEAQVMSRGNRVLTLLADGAFDPAQPPTLTIPAGANSLVIRYAGIDLANPRKVRFTYRLDGLDPDWVDAKGARTAVYAALAPGSYQFQLIAINEHGTLSPPVRLGLRVLPAWWQTWTLRVLVGAMFLFAGPIFYLRRVDLLKRRAVAQTAFARQLIEREEAERKRIALQIHDVLGHDLLLLKNSAEQGAQATSSPAPAREQFELISGLASRTLEEARGISHRLRPPELDRLGFRDAIEALLAKVAATSGLRVFKEVGDFEAVLPPETQVFLYRLVQEGLNNVLKHARASIVMLEIKRDGDALAIKLEDNGVGFAVAAAAQGRAGLGLIGMEERVRLVDGQFEVASTPGAGTRIRITIPLPAWRSRRKQPAARDP